MQALVLLKKMKNLKEKLRKTRKVRQFTVSTAKIISMENNNKSNFNWIFLQKFRSKPGYCDEQWAVMKNVALNYQLDHRLWNESCNEVGRLLFSTWKRANKISEYQKVTRVTYADTHIHKSIWVRLLFWRGTMANMPLMLSKTLSSGSLGFITKQCELSFIFPFKLTSY